ncbi:ureidoglycolate lyase [Bosea caraganae]|nr:ureidoglycolate lyase [Bosea caraganae]
MTATFTLTAEPITAEAFAPYGRLLAPEGPRDAGREGYDIWIKPFAAESVARLQVVRYHARPFVVGMIERHLHVTEARLPLAGAPAAIIVVAPPDLAAPAPRDLRAFRLDGTGAIFHRSTWHAIDAYPVSGAHADFLFLSEEATVNELFVTPGIAPKRTEVIDLAGGGVQIIIDAGP